MNVVNFQPHAIERFIQRHMPGITMPVAHRILRDAVPTARRLRDRTRSGEECWLLAEYDAVMVIRRDGRDGQRVSCLTILPKGAHQGYVHERRIPVPAVVDPTSEALRTAVHYAVASANRGEARAIRVVAEIRRIAPWALIGLDVVRDVARAEPENEDGLPRDSSDAATSQGVARLSHEKSNGGVR